MHVCSRLSTRNWESDLVRPEVVAFRELDTLVRNLSDQLAGYRRRAMAAEARARELETKVADANAGLTAAQADVARWTGVAQRAEAEAAEARAAADEAETHASMASAAAAAAAAVAPRTPVAEAPSGAEAAVPPGDPELVRENEELRNLLVEARERTAQLVERVRFLRQQLGLGAEK